jgi:hypothetical protein
MAGTLPALTKYLPKRFVAHLAQLKMSALYNSPLYPYRLFFERIFFLQLLVVVVYVISSFFKRPRGEGLFVRCTAWAALGFLAFLFYYRPSENYYLYLAFTVPFAFCAVVLQRGRGEEGRRSWPPRLVRGASLLLLLLAAAGTLHFVRYQVRWLRTESAAGSLISLDDRLQALAAMAKRLGWQEESRPIYADHITWIAAGKRHKSLCEICLVPGPIPESIGGAVFELWVIENFLASASLGHVQLTAPEKAERVAALLKHANLSAILFDTYPTHPDTPTAYYFYSPRGQGAAGIRIAKVGSDSTWTASEPISPDGQVQEKISSWSGLAQGPYLLLLDGITTADKELQVGVHAGGDEARSVRRTVRPGLMQQHVAKALWVDVPNDGARVTIRPQEPAAGPASAYRALLFPLKAETP